MWIGRHLGGGFLTKKYKMENSRLIWKHDADGIERPLEEQIQRRKADLIIANDHISWYSRNPIRRDKLRKEIAHQARLKHAEDIRKDIKKLEELIK